MCPRPTRNQLDLSNINRNGWGRAPGRGWGLGGAVQYRPFYSCLLPFAFLSVITSFQEYLGCAESVWKGSFVPGVVKWLKDEGVTPHTLIYIINLYLEFLKKVAPWFCYCKTRLLYRDREAYFKKIIKYKARDPILSFRNSCREQFYKNEKLHQYQ